MLFQEHYVYNPGINFQTIDIFGSPLRRGAFVYWVRNTRTDLGILLQTPIVFSYVYFPS